MSADTESDGGGGARNLFEEILGRPSFFLRTEPGLPGVSDIPPEKLLSFFILD